MFDGLWRSIKQVDYIESLKNELVQVRLERDKIQDTLFRVLKIHLIPENRFELNQELSKQPIEIGKTRDVKSYLNDLQKKSYNLAIQKQIEEEEKRINELELEKDLNKQKEKDATKVS